MYSTIESSAEPVRDIPRISAPTIPAVDWGPVRGSLGSFRAGYEEIEQFVSQLLDEIDAAWQALDAERLRTESLRLAASPSPARGARNGAANELAVRGPHANGTLLPAAVEADPARFSEALVRRVAELEQDRVTLQSEVDFLRGQLTEQANERLDDHHRAADERAAWADELRQLREAIHRQMEALNSQQPAHGGAPANGIAGAPSTAGAGSAQTDPVLGPLVAQFKVLQREADRRRKGPGAADVGANRPAPQAKDRGSRDA